MERKHSALRALLPAGMLCLAVVAACAPQPIQTYEGPARPAEETAKILAGRSVIFDSFDGSEVERSVLQALPGHHELVGTVRNVVYAPLCSVGANGILLCTPLILPSGEAEGSLSFEVEAGKEYVVKGRLVDEKKRAALWLEDAETEAVIAGEPPPRDDD